MMLNSLSKKIFAWSMFSLGYLSLAILCLKARDPWSLSTAIWLPAGLTMIALCHTKPSSWPIWLLTSGVIHTLVSLSFGRPAEVTVLFTLADIIIFTLSSLCWQYFATNGFRISLFAMSLACCGSVLALSLIGGFILFLFFSFMGYPVDLTHSLIWGISGATGALATASFFIFDGGNINYYLSHIRKLSLPKFLILVSAAIVIISFVTPTTVFSTHPVSGYALLFLAWLITVIITVTCSTIFVASHCFLLSITVSLGTLYHLGPFWHIKLNGFGFFISQIYLLSIIITSSLIFSRLKELQNKSDILESIFLVITKTSPITECFSFKYYPDSDLVEWNFASSTLQSRLLSTSSLLLGRVHPQSRRMLATFFRHPCEMSKIVDPVSFNILIMDDKLSYRNATFVFHSPEFRGKIFRITGLLLFH